MFKRGAKVDADFGDNNGNVGYQITFVLSGPDGPEEKYVLQDPNTGRAVSGFAYGEDGGGLTFKKL